MTHQAPAEQPAPATAGADPNAAAKATEPEHVPDATAAEQSAAGEPDFQHDVISWMPTTFSLVMPYLLEGICGPPCMLACRPGHARQAPTLTPQPCAKRQYVSRS